MRPFGFSYSLIPWVSGRTKARRQPHHHSIYQHNMISIEERILFCQIKPMNLDFSNLCTIGMLSLQWFDKASEILHFEYEGLIQESSCKNLDHESMTNVDKLEGSTCMGVALIKNKFRMQIYGKIDIVHRNHHYNFMDVQLHGLGTLYVVLIGLQSFLYYNRILRLLVLITYKQSLLLFYSIIIM